MNEDIDQKNKELARKIRELHTWVKVLKWEENNARTDAKLEVVINPFVGDDDPGSEIGQILLSCSKQDYIDFVESLCVERIDTFTVDALRIELDGDREDTTVSIFADIHLAE